MATYNKFNQFVEDVMHGVHNFGADTFTVALTNSAPVATNSVLANITEISYTNCSSRTLTVPTSEGSDGSYEAVFTDLVLTASGGAIATFRYVVIYNNTPISPLDPLVAWFDYGSAVDVADTETFTLNFGANLVTLT